MIRKVFYVDDIDILNEGKMSGRKEAIIDFESEEEFKKFWAAVQHHDEQALDFLEDAQDIEVNFGIFYENNFQPIKDDWKVEDVPNNLTATFILNDVLIDVCKAFGHKETTIEFNSLEEKNEFIKRVENQDEKAIDQLEDSANLLLDDWSVNDYESWAKWELF